MRKSRESNRRCREDGVGHCLMVGVIGVVASAAVTVSKGGINLILIAFPSNVLSFF